MSEQLKACPFCKSNLALKVPRVGNNYFQHPDNDCLLAETDLGDPFIVPDNPVSIAAWNRRAPAQQAPHSPADAAISVAPVGAQQAVSRDAILEEAAKAVTDHDRKGREWVPGSLWDTLSNEAAQRIRALKGSAQSEEGGNHG